MSRTRLTYPRVNIKKAQRDFRGKLTYRERQELPDSAFAIPEQRKYPIYNASHARNALARVSKFGTDSEKEKVCHAVSEKWPEIHAKHCHIHKPTQRIYNFEEKFNERHGRYPELHEYPKH